MEIDTNTRSACQQFYYLCLIILCHVLFSLSDLSTLTTKKILLSSSLYLPYSKNIVDSKYNECVRKVLEVSLSHTFAAWDTKTILVSETIVPIHNSHMGEICVALCRLNDTSTLRFIMMLCYYVNN